jgi:hypothetical protein
LSYFIRADRLQSEQKLSLTPTKTKSGAFPTVFEVDPLSWTPEHLCSRSPRCRRQDHPTHRNSVAQEASAPTKMGDAGLVVAAVVDDFRDVTAGPSGERTARGGQGAQFPRGRCCAAPGKPAGPLKGIGEEFQECSCRSNRRLTKSSIVWRGIVVPSNAANNRKRREASTVVVLADSSEWGG